MVSLLFCYFFVSSIKKPSEFYFEDSQAEMDDQAAIQLREQVFKPELKTRNATHHLRIYLKIFFIWLFNDVSMALFSLELVGNGFPRQGSIPRNQATIVISEVYVITVWSNLNGALVWSDLKCLTIPHFCKKNIRTYFPCKIYWTIFIHPNFKKKLCLERVPVCQQNWFTHSTPGNHIEISCISNYIQTISK